MDENDENMKPERICNDSAIARVFCTIDTSIYFSWFLMRWRSVKRSCSLQKARNDHEWKRVEICLLEKRNSLLKATL
jgi:hypothetical protein